MNSLCYHPQTGSLVAFRVLGSNFTYGEFNDFDTVYPGLYIGEIDQNGHLKEVVFPDNGSISFTDESVISKLSENTRQRVIFAIESTETLKQLLRLNELKIQERDDDSDSYPWIEYYPIDAHDSKRDTPNRETLETTMRQNGFQLIYGVDQQIQTLLRQLQG